MQAHPYAQISNLVCIAHNSIHELRGACFSLAAFLQGQQQSCYAQVLLLSLVGRSYF